MLAAGAVLVAGVLVSTTTTTYLEGSEDEEVSTPASVEVVSTLVPSRTLVLSLPSAAGPPVALPERRSGPVDARPTRFMPEWSSVQGGYGSGLVAELGEVRRVTLFQVCASPGAEVAVTGVRAQRTRGDVDVVGALVTEPDGGLGPDESGWEPVERERVTAGCRPALQRAPYLAAAVALRGAAGEVCGFVVEYTEDEREREYLVPVDVSLSADPGAIDRSDCR